METRRGLFTPDFFQHPHPVAAHNFGNILSTETVFQQRFGEVGEFAHGTDTGGVNNFAEFRIVQ